MNEEFEVLDELQLDGEEFELIRKRMESQFDEPVVTISSRQAYFNTLAADLVPERIRWYTTTNYVIGLPAEEDDKNGYIAKKANGAMIAFFPHKLRVEKKVKEGYYKIYKYKDGFAFKRYEQYKRGQNG